MSYTHNALVERLVRDALAEDIGHGDLTTDTTVPENARCAARLVAKQDGVLSGIQVFRMAFECLDAGLAGWSARADGDRFTSGDEIAAFTGLTRAILTAERTAMNFVQHLSGVATLTAAYVEAVHEVDVRVTNTRKTTPLLRYLEKAAVVHGGGWNHRHGLSDGVLIKENHIVAAGGISQAVRGARDTVHHLLRIEVEVASLTELEEAIAAGADVIMLDNMDTGDMTEAVRRVQGTDILLEASGNISLQGIRAVAETGVHIISVGALTHSAPAVDLSLVIENA
jgi:nicotinate-nucleotide pyrophosphorylase (carboxylating)